MFEGFETKDIATSGATINLVQGGSGPPLLLLHGYPQTHTMWHKVAPRLAQHYTVVAADLRGYGDSSKPASDPEHLVYSKRSTAQDMAEVMQALGFPEFSVAGHDRGGRVTHRLTRDYPDRVRKAAFLDIIPTVEMWKLTTTALKAGPWHWYFLMQPEPLPETLIGNSADYFIRSSFRQGAPVFPPEAVDEYARCFTPGAIHAMCEDYRAAATIDLQHDEPDAGAKLAMPVLALWGKTGGAARNAAPLEVWQRYADDVRGREFSCGHYLAEEQPDEVYAELRAFFG